MLGASSRIFLVLFSFTSINAELVQYVTPENVEVTTAATFEDASYPKRETSGNDTFDSYLEALKESQGATSRYDPPNASAQGSLYDAYNDHQENSYGPPQGYQPSKPSYHKVQPRPAPPVQYGPPSPVSSYLPSQLPMSPQQPAPFYGIPFAASPNIIMSVLQNIMPKGIDLETVFKLLLKLTLFKMVVKLIGVICLLLAYPLFQSKEKEEMMEEDDKKRQYRQFEALNDLTGLVWDSIYPPRYINGTAEEDPDGLVEKVAGEIDEKMTVPSEEAAISFLEFCVAAANTVVGWMMSFVKRRNNEIDPIEEFLWSLWEKIKHSLRVQS